MAQGLLLRTLEEEPLRIIARTKTTSTCPLCRADVLRARGRRCRECGAVCHPSCARELGACHPGSLEPAAAPPIPRQPPVAAPPIQRQPAPSVETGRSALALATGVIDRLGWGFIVALAVSLVPLAIVNSVWRDFDLGFCTLSLGWLGTWGLYEAGVGLRTGSILAPNRNCSARIRWSQNPIHFLAGLMYYGGFGGGLLLFVLAMTFES